MSDWNLRIETMSMSQMNLDFDDDDDYDTDTVSTVEVPLCPNHIGPRRLTKALLFPDFSSPTASHLASVHWFCLLRLRYFTERPSLSDRDG